jgi:hypothetical protein
VTTLQDRRTGRAREGRTAINRPAQGSGSAAASKVRGLHDEHDMEPPASQRHHDTKENPLRHTGHQEVRPANHFDHAAIARLASRGFSRVTRSHS